MYLHFVANFPIFKREARNSLLSFSLAKKNKLEVSSAKKKKKSKVLSGFKINNINKIFINLLCEEAMLSRTPAQWLNTLHITFTAQSDLLMADHRWVSFR